MAVYLTGRFLHSYVKIHFLLMEKRQKEEGNMKFAGLGCVALEIRLSGDGEADEDVVSHSGEDVILD